MSVWKAAAEEQQLLGLYLECFEDSEQDRTFTCRRSTNHLLSDKKLFSPVTLNNKVLQLVVENEIIYS